MGEQKALIHYLNWIDSHSDPRSITQGRMQQVSTKPFTETQCSGFFVGNHKSENDIKPI